MSDDLPEGDLPESVTRMRRDAPHDGRSSFPQRGRLPERTFVEHLNAMAHARSEAVASAELYGAATPPRELAALRADDVKVSDMPPDTVLRSRFVCADGERQVVAINLTTGEVTSIAVAAAPP